VSSQSTSLVTSARQDITRQASTSAAANRLDDRYVWTVSVGDDGSFNFYAVPRTITGNNNASSDGSSSSSSSAKSSYSGWSIPPSRDAAAQYAFYAGMTMQMTGRLIDVYA